MALNKIEALAAPPGHSLTDPMGKWAWENPPQFADPNDAVDFVIDKMQRKGTQDDLLKNDGCRDNYRRDSWSGSF